MYFLQFLNVRSLNLYPSKQQSTMAGDGAASMSSPTPSLRITVAGEGGSAAHIPHPADLAANEEVSVDAVVPSSPASCDCEMEKCPQSLFLSRCHSARE